MNRITVVESVYHQSGDNQPTVTPSSYERRLESDEQPFVRRFPLEESKGWAVIPPGCWIQSASLLILRNDLPTYEKTPSAEQRAEAAACVVDVGIGLGLGPVAFAELIPGESLRLTPVDLSTIMMRCRKGVARLSLAVYPK